MERGKFRILSFFPKNDQRSWICNLQNVYPQLINGPGDREPNNHQHLLREGNILCLLQLK